ncbi:MAG TPA: HAMP domain-containing protein [Nitrospinaceae bacterium]|nr:HAMP domain-containing protein [Nitrospinaceae bacterium]|tara:strand:- start:197 stop:1396 length:1200 start_codon:yes stop_codon:yes gene_type:complete
MFKFRDMTIGKKVGFGFGVINLILMGVVLLIIQQVKSMEVVTKRVVELRTPTAHASLMMLNGINHSLASLRGWIILGDPKFQKERSIAWEEQINPSLQLMHGLAPNWTDPENQVRLKSIEEEINYFKMAQQKIEDIAQTPENSPAQKILFEKAEPLEKSIISIVSKMIQLEMKGKASIKHQQQLEILANIETAVSLALERADEFLLSGKQEFKKESQKNWQKSVEYMKVLQSRKNSLAKKQAQNFKKLNSGLEQLGSFLEEIVRIRSGTDWNLANHWVKTDAAPVAFRIKELLSDMTSVQEELLEIDVEEVSSRTHYLIVLLVALFFSVVLISGVLGANITRSISEPILKVCKLADELAHGNHKNTRLPVLARNEWGTLSQSFNELLDRLQEEKQKNKG